MRIFLVCIPFLISSTIYIKLFSIEISDKPIIDIRCLDLQVYTMGYIIYDRLYTINQIQKSKYKKNQSNTINYTINQKSIKL